MPGDTSDRRALLQRAYAAIEEQQAKIRALEARIAGEPLAIVGLSCRFPGASDPDAFWQLLQNGTDAITEIPRDRWDVDAFYDPDPDTPGKMYTRHGGFLSDVAGFDAAFFGISPREALAMDPQQRLLLETTWDALDRAGQPRDRLAGSSTGVFIGITASEYQHLQPNGLTGIDAYHVTGNTLNAAAGRLAYTLGFRGPAVAVDTACSSSLVAVHLACAAIRNGDCDQAIAGGVHLILSPAGHIALSKARVLSPNGRCRTFSASADGMARGEGCGVIVIRRLADALRDGDPIVAVIRGSAVNQDGPSGGLTVPNGPAQEDVIRRALANARVSPSQVRYVEAHGTATPLGDPIEISALAAVYGADRPADAPLLVGSVKTNLGHMEAAAGIAGLIKVALSLERGAIPPHIHFDRPSPQIAWDALPIEIVANGRPWPAGDSPRIAGISAFGFSGTNAHVVLEEAPASPPVQDAAAPPVFVFRVAARSDAAFRELAQRYADHIGAHEEQPLADICYTANTGRGDGAERGAVVAADRASLVAGLRALARGETREGVFRGRSVERRGESLGLEGIADRRARLERAAEAYVSGVAVDWASLDEGGPRRRVLLPTYPWQRQRFWPERAAAVEVPSATDDPCAGWTYEIVWQEQPRQRALLPSGRAIERRLLPHLHSTRRDRRTEAYAQALDRLERRAEAHAAAALRALGVDPHALPESELDALAARLEVVETYRPLFARLVDIVRRAGVIEDHDPTDALIAACPSAEAEFRLLDRCAEALPDVVRGRRDPLEVLFPSDDSTSAAHLYGEARAAVVMNRLLEQLVHLLAREAAVPLRLLEIGAGTGGTTAAILAALGDKGAAEYVFTDISPTFFDRAKARFAHVPYLRTARLDISAPPEDQRLGPHHDVVIAANVLHATPDLGRALDHASRLLAPGGLLVLQEWTGALAALDLIFGLTSGWWSFADRDVRPSHPLVDAGRWRALLEAHGFEDVAVLGSAPDDRGALAKQAVFVARRRAPVSRVLVLGDPAGAGTRLCEALRARGREADLIEGAAVPAVSADTAIVDLRALDARPAGGDGAADVESDAERVSTGLTELVQQLARAGAAPRLNIVTRRAVAAVPGDSASGVAESAAWGIGKVVALEHPELNARLIDIDGASDASALIDVIEVGNEPQVAIRRGRVWVPRLAPHQPPHRDSELTFDGKGAYLVTGGFGGLGLVIAEWLARKGAGLIVLTGRREPSFEARETIQRLEQGGARLLVRVLDVTNRAQLDAVLDETRRTGARIAGIFHAAGVLDDGVVMQVNADRLVYALRPKLLGAWHLHEATRADRLDAFVLFSAATSMFGSAGQASHAAANAVLDAFAAWRRASGLPALSVNWGAWSRVGAASGAGMADRIRMKGVQAIEPERALAILERLMQGTTPQVGVFAVDWSAIPEAMRGLPFLSNLVASLTASQVSADTAAAPAQPSILDEFRAAPAHRRRGLLSSHVRAEIARVLGFAETTTIDMKQGLFELGFDSLSSMDLRNRLQETCGCALPATLAFDCPTPDAIVTHLLERMAPAPAADAGVAEELGRKLAELRGMFGS